MTLSGHFSDNKFLIDTFPENPALNGTKSTYSKEVLLIAEQERFAS